MRDLVGRRARLALIALVGASAAVTVPTAAASSGDLDDTFGDGGTVSVDLGDVVEEASAVEVLPDGDILVASKRSSFEAFSGPVLRFDADGRLDSSFGDGGVASTYATGCAFCGSDLAVQADGKIVVAGSSTYPFLWSTGVVRFNADGTPDTGFGREGLAGSANLYGVGEGIAVQPDGKIVVVSLGSESTGAPALMLLRLLPDGTPDTDWGPDGQVRVSVGADPFGDSLAATDVVIQPDGKIVAAATVGPRWGDPDQRTLMARLLPDGTIDTSFGDAGLFQTDALISPAEVAIQPDGKFVATGESRGETGTDFAVIRVGGDGTLDTSFGDAGRAVARTEARGSTVAVRPDGRIVAAGDNWQLGGYHLDTEFVVAVYLPDGSLDPTFGDAGVATTNHLPGTEGEFVNDLAVQPDGKIVVAGQAWTLTGERDVTLDRYLVNTPPTVAVVGGACSGDTGADVTLTVADAETPASDLIVSATSSNAAVITDDQLAVGTGGTDRTLAVRPSDRATGAVDVTVTVDDGEAATTTTVSVALGGTGANELTGTAASDVLLGRQGDDAIVGDDGPDILCGGRGNDSLDGGPGDDHLGGDRGDDVLTGGPGADAFIAGAGTDTAVDASTADGDVLSSVP
jgi:uncharacterized delta-60 repeat protein